MKTKVVGEELIVNENMFVRGGRIGRRGYFFNGMKLACLSIAYGLLGGFIIGAIESYFDLSKTSSGVIEAILFLPGIIYLTFIWYVNFLKRFRDLLLTSKYDVLVIICSWIPFISFVLSMLCLFAPTGFLSKK